MHLLFDSQTGEIHHVVPDRDWDTFEHSTAIPLEDFVIEEWIPANRAVCIDLWQMQYRRDKEGQGRYYLVRDRAGSGWELHARDGWESYEERMGIDENLIGTQLVA